MTTTNATATLEKEIIDSLTSEPTEDENDQDMPPTKQASTRERALEEAIAQIEKNYGRGSVMLMSENESFRNVEAIPTGSLSPRHRSRHWRTSTRANHRGLRCRIGREIDPRNVIRRAGAKSWRCMRIR